MITSLQILILHLIIGTSVNHSINHVLHFFQDSGIYFNANVLDHSVYDSWSFFQKQSKR